jgi:hypothetical protein
MPALTPQQTIFTLSMLSNLGHCFSGTVEEIEAQLTPVLEDQLSLLQPKIGTWTLVWGPAVYLLPTSSRPDNIMFVARQSGASQLVVSIAGTNPYSVLNFIVEDFMVRTQVPWFSGVPFSLDRKISLGTFIGFSVLQALKPGASQPGAGSTVRDFLATQVSAPITVNVGGHSLGGALSPTLALWLHDTRKKWDPANNASLSVLPSAGPTAGNRDFATYSDAQIGPQVTRIHNKLDVVPHAWTTAALEQVPDLYAPDIEPDDLVKLLVALAIDASKEGSYMQINPGAKALPGSAVNKTIIKPREPFLNFLRQVGYQHVDAYYELLGVPELGQIMACVKQSAQLVEDDLAARLQGKIAKFSA